MTFNVYEIEHQSKKLLTLDYNHCLTQNTVAR